MIDVSSVEIAKYVVFQLDQKAERIVNLKLQKILYYIQGYSFRRNGVPAFDDNIVHWPYGPVALEAYYYFCAFGGREIRRIADKEIPDIRDKKLKQTADGVIEKSRDLSVKELVIKTLNETPWKRSVDRGIISREAIEDYFKKNDPLCLEFIEK